MIIVTLYSFISSGLSYVFTTIIYLFIFSVIRLIYLDIGKMSAEDKRRESKTVSEDGYGGRNGNTSKDVYKNDGSPMNRSLNTAVLHTIRNKESAELRLKKQYFIEEFAVFGRGSDCEIRINNKFLSIEHFQIWFEDGVWYLLDMRSRNGTYVNDMRVRKPVMLNDGDEISAGGLEFVFEIID